jgi:hypothetical protein
LTGYLVLIFHFKNAHYININRTFKAKTENKTSLPRICIYLFRVPYLLIGKVFAFQLFRLSVSSLLRFFNLSISNLRVTTFFSQLFALSLSRRLGNFLVFFCLFHSAKIRVLFLPRLYSLTVGLLLLIKKAWVQSAFRLFLPSPATISPLAFHRTMFATN